jgi:hypothetical protein
MAAAAETDNLLPAPAALRGVESFRKLGAQEGVDIAVIRQISAMWPSDLAERSVIRICYSDWRPMGARRLHPLVLPEHKLKCFGGSVLMVIQTNLGETLCVPKHWLNGWCGESFQSV